MSPSGGRCGERERERGPGRKGKEWGKRTWGESEAGGNRRKRKIATVRQTEDWEEMHIESRAFAFKESVYQNEEIIFSYLCRVRHMIAAMQRVVVLFSQQISVSEISSFFSLSLSKTKYKQVTKYTNINTRHTKQALWFKYDANVSVVLLSGSIQSV